MRSQVRFFNTQISPNGDPQRAIDVEFRVTRTCKGLPLLGTISHDVNVSHGWGWVILQGSLDGCIDYIIEPSVAIDGGDLLRFINENTSTFIGLFNPKGITS